MEPVLVDGVAVEPLVEGLVLLALMSEPAPAVAAVLPMLDVPALLDEADAG